jgi:hypothetical protein
MSTATDHPSELETPTALRGMLALLVADRGADRAEPILARAGLDDAEIASVTGRNANQVRETTSRPQSVIDRAREYMTRAGSTR